MLGVVVGVGVCFAVCLWFLVVRVVFVVVCVVVVVRVGGVVIGLDHLAPDPFPLDPPSAGASHDSPRTPNVHI